MRGILTGYEYMHYTLTQEINFLPLADRKLAQFPANGLVGITIYERKKMRQM